MRPWHFGVKIHKYNWKYIMLLLLLDDEAVPTIPADIDDLIDTISFLVYIKDEADFDLNVNNRVSGLKSTLEL